jgi:hypothetical protein
LPETFLGDPNWIDYEVATDALIEKAGFVSLFGRVQSVPQNASPPEGYWLKVDHTGEWELGTAKAALAAGRVRFSADGWHRLKLAFSSTCIKAFIDRRLIASITDETYPCGMAGIGSGWHRARFDSFSIVSQASDLNLALGRAATASSSAGVDYAPAQVTDGDGFTTRWCAADGTVGGQWLEIDLGASHTFNTVTLKPFEDRITHYKIQHWSGSEWLDAFTGINLGAATKTVAFPSVTSDRVRLLVVEAKSSPSLWELEVRHRP